MSEPTDLEKHLATFIVPQTARPLGEAGTRISVEAESRVAVHCG